MALVMVRAFILAHGQSRVPSVRLEAGTSPAPKAGRRVDRTRQPEFQPPRIGRATCRPGVSFRHSSCILLAKGKPISSNHQTSAPPIVNNLAKPRTGTEIKPVCANTARQQRQNKGRPPIRLAPGGVVFERVEPPASFICIQIRQVPAARQGIARPISRHCSGASRRTPFPCSWGVG